jgi:hypothetical protein
LEVKNHDQKAGPGFGLPSYRQQVYIENEIKQKKQSKHI